MVLWHAYKHMRGMSTGLRCGLTKTNQDFSTMRQSPVSASGAHTRRARCLRKLCWIFTTWVRIGKKALLSEEQHARSVIHWAREYRDPSPANTPAGISMMKRFGSLAASELQTSVPGPLQRKRAIGFPRFR